MEKDLIIVFSGTGANDAIAGLMVDYGSVLEEAGHPVMHVSFEPAELDYAVRLMREGRVAFAITWLGFGQDLAVKAGGSNAAANVFEAFNVPLVKLQGDLPAYFIQFHRDIPRNSVNLYQAQEFLQFRKSWLPEATAFAATIPPMAMVPMDVGNIKGRSRREGTLFFLKNGNSPEALERMWDTNLPSPIAATARKMAHELRANSLDSGTILIGDFVARFLEQDGLAAPVPSRFVWFLAAQMDDYLRRVKSTLIAEALLDLPIVVQGSFWDHIDFSGRRARWLPGKSVFESQEIVLNELGVIDMSANVNSWPHDRVQRAAGAYALVLTNRQQWLTDSFSDFTDLTFDFNAESIADRVADVLSHPGRYVDLAIAFGDRFRQVFPREAVADRMISLVSYARLMWDDPKPMLQNFFVWPEP